MLLLKKSPIHRTNRPRSCRHHRDVTRTRKTLLLHFPRHPHEISATHTREHWSAASLGWRPMVKWHHTQGALPFGRSQDDLTCVQRTKNNHRYNEETDHGIAGIIVNCQGQGKPFTLPGTLTGSSPPTRGNTGRPPPWGGRPW